jgi:hypothetical protein
MPINLSARNYKLVIDGLDCTNCLVSADGGWSHYDQSGLALIEATFILKRSIDWTESLDDRTNQRWARGKIITLDVADSANTLRPAPILGHLRILNAEYDGISQLKIEAGCILNLLNFRTPLGDGACFDLGTATDLNAIAIKLLQKTGISGFSGSIAGAPLTVSLPKLSNESYVQLFGKLCWANGCIAYQDNFGAVKVKNVSLFPIPIHTKSVGFDDAKYDRLTGTEKPCEKIRVTGVINRTKKTEPLTTTVADEYGPLLLIDPESNSTGIILLSKTITTEKLDFQARTKTADTKKYEPLGRILPTEYPGRTGLALSEAVQETSYYEQQQDYANAGEDNCNNPDEGKLIKNTIIIFRTFGIVLREWMAANPKSIFIGTLNPVIAQSQLTSYEYKIKKKSASEPEIAIIPKITSSTYIPIGAILPNENWATIPLSLVVSESKAQIWEEIRLEEWKYTEDFYQNIIIAFPELFDKPKDKNKSEPSISAKLTLTRKERKVIASNSGQATPPAPERFPPTHSIKQEQVKVEVNIPASFGSQFRPREREFSVDSGLLTSKSQAEKIGRIEGHMLWGRYKGQSIAIALSDELFSISPLVGSIWSDLSGSRHLFMIDGFSVAFTNNRFAAQFDGIWCGTVASGVVITPNEPIPPGAISPPYVLIEDVEIGAGWGFEIIDYPYSIEPVFLDATFASGSGFAVLIPADFTSINLNSGFGFAILDDADMIAISIGFGSRVEIYQRKETVIVLGSGFGFKVVNGLINERLVGIGTGFRFDASPVLFIGNGVSFNVRSFSLPDSESDNINLGSGNGFEVGNTLVDDAEIVFGTGFNIRSFALPDSESDNIDLGSGNGFEVGNTPIDDVEIGSGTGLNIRSFSLPDSESDNIDLGSGNGFEVGNTPIDDVEIGSGTGLNIRSFSLPDSESDNIDLGSGNGFEVGNTPIDDVEIGSGTGLNIRSFALPDTESDNIDLGSGNGFQVESTI